MFKLDLNFATIKEAPDFFYDNFEDLDIIFF